MGRKPDKKDERIRELETEVCALSLLVRCLELRLKKLGFEFEPEKIDMRGRKLDS